MSDSLEEGVTQIKATGLDIDEEHIREALRSCNNNPEEAMQLLMPESPEQDVNRLGYNLITTQSSTTSSTYERDIDMRDTETHPGSGGESDRDSTTVSYSLDDERNIEVEEEDEEGEGEEGTQDLQFQVSNDDTVELSDIPPRPNGQPPRYEDIIPDDQIESLSPGEKDSLEEAVPETTPVGQGIVAGSIEFPLTHFYELESRVHTDQWSIPYKRDESLAICMMATTNMIREGT